MFKPFLSEKELEFGNLEASTAICTLWSPRKEFIKKYLANIMNKIAVVGNLYSVYGIGIIIRNFLANPQLRYLIVGGTELGKSNEGLKKLTELNESLLNKIFLSREQVERFLAQVDIFNIEPGFIADFVNELDSRNMIYENQAFKAIELPLPKPSVNVFPASGAGHLIRARTIAEGYAALLQEIRLFGHVTGSDSEGHRRQELWQLSMVITEQAPEAFDTIPHHEYGEIEIRKYCEDFWNGTEPADLAYRYGHIIRYGFGDQVEALLEAFKKKFETFRTVISLWNPHVDCGSIVSEDPPCITLIHPRIIQNKLVLFAYIRTNDMFSGWPLNVTALRYFQWKFLERLRDALQKPELNLGELEVQSGSAHFYERDWVQIDTTISDSPQPKFLPDPKGNFEIKVEDEIIVIRHYSPEGEFLQEFSGTNAEKLSQEITPFVSQIKNAMYIGRSLMAAEIKLNS